MAVSAFTGVLLWVVLMFAHEEWRELEMGGAAGPPPFNPFNVWTLLALIVGIWVLLDAFLRWADKPERRPNRL
jgi:hypothetical protein